MEKIKIGLTIYDTNGNEGKITKLDLPTIYATINRKTIIRHGSSAQYSSEFKLENSTFNINKAGILFFFDASDVNLGKSIINNDKYSFNIDNIKEYYKNQELSVINEIKKNAPNNHILSLEEREKLVLSYLDEESNIKEEEEFYKKYKGKYYARMDFDIEFFKKKFPELFKEHYYEKVYVGKTGAVRDDEGKLVIVDWRSPIGGFVIETQNRFINPDKDPLYTFNYELLLKRRFSTLGDKFQYKDVFIVNSSLYKDGDVDIYLRELAERFKRAGKDGFSDIIETIQAKQNEIVRSDINLNFRVQGCAGSGKTMILLHRLSYLTYNYKNLDTSKIVIITPNENIITQMRSLSAQLEVSNIRQLTIEQYYLELLNDYSNHLYAIYSKNHNKILNENVLPDEFLRHIYSDDFRNILDNHYHSYFDNIYETLSKYISINNNENYKSLVENSNSLYYFNLKLKDNKAKKEELLKEKDKLTEQKKIFINEYNEYKKNHKDVADIQNKIEEINLSIEKLENNLKFLKDKIEIEKTINNLQKNINSLSEKKENFNSLNFISTEKIELESEKQYEQKIKTLNKDINNLKEKLTNNIQENKTTKTNIENDEKLKIATLDEYNKTKTVQFIKKNRLKNKLVELKNNIESYKLTFQNLNIEENQLKEKIKLEEISLSNHQYSYSLFVKEQLNKLKNKLKQYKLNLKIIIDNKELLFDKQEIKNKISELTKDKDSLTKQIKNDLIEISKVENQIQKCEKSIKDYDDKINIIYPYTSDDEAEIKKLLDLLLVKNDETKEYERKIKITDHRIASDIIEPLISQTYLKFNIQRDEKDNTFYKHSLYILLYILQRLHGKKSIDKMLNIDEAQDITINEYKVIKDANENATFNLYGDTLQLLYQGRGIEKWEEIQFLFDKPFKLNQNYRNVSNITKFCNHELGIEMESMSIDGDEVDYINIEKFNELPKEYVLIIKNLDTLKTLNLKLEEYNIISNKSDLMKSNKINIFTVEMVKGMEFSKVVVYANDMKKREKYIAYTRALNTLKILVD